MNLSDIRAILFDVDGTLFSSEEIIHQVYIEEFTKCKERLGRPTVVPTRDQIIAEVGKPVPIIFKNLAPELTESERSEVSRQILLGLVDSIKKGGGHYYDGVHDTLHSLQKRKYRLFTASNGRPPYVNAILDASRVTTTFEAISVLDEKTTDKIALVQRILNEHSLSSENAVLVGDRASDREAAEENGLGFIACSFGHGTSAEWGKPIAVIDRISTLLDLFPGF